MVLHVLTDGDVKLGQDVDVAVKARRRAFKAWKAGKGTKDTYYVAKRTAKGAVHHARKDADSSSGAIKTVFNMQTEGKRGPGRPKMTKRTLTERDRSEWKLNEIDPCARDLYRSSVRSANVRS